MRVILDFDYPLNKVWEGYLNPIHPLTCEACEGRGESPEVRNLYDQWYGRYEIWEWCDETHTRRWNRAAWRNNLDEDDVAALLEADRLWDFTRVPITEEQRQIVKEKMAKGENSWLPYDNGYVPTPEEVNEWNRQGLGHDSLNAWIVVKATALKLGWPIECAVCKGEGHFWTSPEQREAHEAWRETEPPAGEGYQLWETTSEGSPQSPVFASLDELCAWCAENATTFASYTATAEEWKQMLDEDFVQHTEGNITFI